MKRASGLILLLLASLPVVCTAQLPAAQEKFPEKKWFQNGKGYAEALEIQKATGADLFVYFARNYPKDEEGLCHWFEKRSLQNPTVEKYLRGYVKVKFTYPLSKDDEELAIPFKVNKCPAVFVVSTNAWRNRIAVFDWDTGKQPKPIEPDPLVESIRAKSGPRYQVATDPATK